MDPKKYFEVVIVIILFELTISGCINIRGETTESGSPKISNTSQALPTSSLITIATLSKSDTDMDFSDYSFPGSIDPAERYMFYLHGKIIEDQGIPALSPDFGEYEYRAILEELSENGFVVISEPRQKNTDVEEYAEKIIGQITTLLNRGVPAESITVLGASKGAAIAIYISHLLENDEMNFVIMAICHPDEVEYFKQNQVSLHGNILSIYDSSDEFAGSCQELFLYSESRGVLKYEEIILDVGLGHGILYQPMEVWVTPVIQWIRKP